jgi:hypothetical protein
MNWTGGKSLPFDVTLASYFESVIMAVNPTLEKG